MTISFGPSGLGPTESAIKTLEQFHKLGIKACEIAFTRGVYIKDKQDAIEIGEKAKELGIKLSIHAPYFINLNSLEKEKIEQSKKRILECCKIGTYLQAYRVVFHAGFYLKMPKEQAYENIKKAIIDIQKEIKEKKYTPKLAPEIMGKVNVFGSIEEIKKLVDETGCEMCIDFAHILARYKDYKLKETLESFKKSKELHIHFSGIEYGDKGEKNHKKTSEKEISLLLSSLPKDKEITIINESPFPIEDSLLSLKIMGKIH
jgi:deoxyribonuclease-4